MEICSDFVHGDPRKAWDGLKKLTESLSSSSSSNSDFSSSSNSDFSSSSNSDFSSSNVLKDRNGNLLCTPRDLVNRFGEHYEALASDVTGHSLDQKYWQECLGPPSTDTTVWNINGPITMDEIQKVVRSMQCNKAPGPDGLPVEFYKAFFESSLGPTVDPAVDPTVDPAVDPTVDPAVDPTVDPAVDPTVDPTVDPAVDPTVDPAVDPTVDPAVDPTVDPAVDPTVDPAVDPGIDPINAFNDSSYSDCAKCLLILFNKIWNGDFPSD